MKVLPYERPPKPNPDISMNLPSTIAAINSIDSAAYTFAQKAGFLENSDRIELVAREMAINAIQDGNKSNPAKKVSVFFYDFADRAEIWVGDADGTRFDYKKRFELNPRNLLRQNGRGIFLAKTFSDELIYVWNGRGSGKYAVATFRKALPEAA